MQTLLAQRADLDSKLLILATDISQIVGAAFVNAAASGASIPEQPAQQPAPKKEKKVKPVVEQPVVEQPVVELHVVGQPVVEAPPAPVTKIPTQDQLQELVNKVVAEKGATNLGPIASQFGPFGGLTDEQKVEFYGKVEALLQ